VEAREGRGRRGYAQRGDAQVEVISDRDDPNRWEISMEGWMADEWATTVPRRVTRS
jgi:hypothetical protein